jgi:hypothetical protein
MWDGGNTNSIFLIRFMKNKLNSYSPSPEK